MSTASSYVSIKSWEIPVRCACAFSDFRGYLRVCAGSCELGTLSLRRESQSEMPRWPAAARKIIDSRAPLHQAKPRVLIMKLSCSYDWCFARSASTLR